MVVLVVLLCNMAYRYAIFLFGHFIFFFGYLLSWLLMFYLHFQYITNTLPFSRSPLSIHQHAELDMNRYMAPPGEEAVVDEEGEPTEHCKYTMFDGKVFNTSVPGDKLKCLQFRFDGLTKALASASDLGTCHAPLVESAQKNSKQHGAPPKTPTSPCWAAARAAAA